MSRLTWVQPPDLLAHELVASRRRGQGRRRRARAAGSPPAADVEAPVAGVGQVGDAGAAGAGRRPARRAGRAARSTRPCWPASPTTSGDRGACADGRPSATAGDDLRGPAARRPGRPGGRLPARQAGGEDPPRGHPRDPAEPGPVAADRLVHRGRPARRRGGALAVEPPQRADQPGREHRRHARGRRPQLPACSPSTLLERHGRGFTTDDVADAWLAGLPGGRVFTAERVAYRNLLLGVRRPRDRDAAQPVPRVDRRRRSAPTSTAGSHPGDPAAAARLALDATRGSATSATASTARCSSPRCLRARSRGHEQTSTRCSRPGCPSYRPRAGTPRRSRFGADLGRAGLDPEAALDRLHADVRPPALGARAQQRRAHGVRADRRARRLRPRDRPAVTGGWDTDSVGATVGSVVRRAGRRGGSPSGGSTPLQNRLASSLPGFDGIGFDRRWPRRTAGGGPVSGARRRGRRQRQPRPHRRRARDPGAGRDRARARPRGPRRRQGPQPGGRRCPRRCEHRLRGRGRGRRRRRPAPGRRAASPASTPRSCAGCPAPSGTAWIMVQPDGENAIVVDSGANADADLAHRRRARRWSPAPGAGLAQLEVPLAAVTEALRRAWPATHGAQRRPRARPAPTTCWPWSTCWSSTSTRPGPSPASPSPTTRPARCSSTAAPS